MPLTQEADPHLDPELVKMGFHSVAESNAAWMRACDETPDGQMMKAASAGDTNFIRRELKENAFSTNVISLKPCDDSMFDRQVDSELPTIVKDMEAASPAAKSITFNDGPDTVFYRGRRFMVRIATITTPEFVKNIDELRTYEMDLRQVTTDNALKEMETEMDGRFMATVDRIVGSTSGLGESGSQQNFEIDGRITRQTYPDLKNFLEGLRLNNGVWLVNRHTSTEFLKFDRVEYGGDEAQTLWRKGLTGLDKFEILGIPHMATIKDELVPNFVVYMFTEAGYLGKGYELQETTMYVEKKKDILRFSAMRKLGLTIAAGIRHQRCVLGSWTRRIRRVSLGTREFCRRREWNLEMVPPLSLGNIDAKRCPAYAW